MGAIPADTDPPRRSHANPLARPPARSFSAACSLLPWSSCWSGELAAERGGDVLNGFELLGGERVDEKLADGPQMRHGCRAERRLARRGKHDLGGAVGRRALLPVDQPTAFPAAAARGTT